MTHSLIKSLFIGKDSFRAFEEALEIARDRGVDFILLGGDLFHVNKPSPSVEHRCIKIIRKHMNAKATKGGSQLKRISGNFSHCNKVNHANFEDPNLTVQHPIFTIHGNHDDPTGPQSQSVCEKLATCGLLNYFGAFDHTKSIHIEPIVFQKNGIKIALYGMGFIPDFKLKRAFDEGNVTFAKPPRDSYNILVVHQNRVPLNKAKYIPDEYYPKFFHLIVRGHEHMSEAPTKIPDSQVEGEVFQPGSTVATSISAMEAGPKQVAIVTLRVNLNNSHYSSQMYNVEWSLVKLLCCRPIIFKDISQKEMYKHIKDKHGDSKITGAVFKRYSREFIESKIEEFLHSFKITQTTNGAYGSSSLSSSSSYRSSATITISPATISSSVSDKYSKIAAAYLPILRVRLEYVAKAEKFDPHEISDKLFPERVANKDIVLFKKQKVRRTESGEMENITFQTEDDEDEQEDEDFDYIDLGWEQKETIDLMIENYFKDKPEEERLKGLSLREYVSAVQRTGDDGNVISKVLNRKKQVVMSKYRNIIGNQNHVEGFLELAKVQEWFLREFGTENANIAAGGDAWDDLIEVE